MRDLLPHGGHPVDHEHLGADADDNCRRHNQRRGERNGQGEQQQGEHASSDTADEEHPLRPVIHRDRVAKNRTHAVAGED
jgi:hypothetical protein